MNATSGRISPTPFAYYDRELSCWRTSQATLALDLTPSSVTLPRSGSMRNGELFERPTLARPTGGSDCSSLRFDTPDTMPEAPNSGSNRKAQPAGLLNQVRTLLSTPQARDGKGVPGKGFNQPNLARDVSLLPTPAVNDMGAGNPNDGEQPETWLARRERVKLTANNGNGMGTPLSIAVQLLPTPSVADATGGHMTRGGARSHELLLPGVAVAITGGTMNPQSDDGSPPSDVQHPTPPPSGEPGALF